MEHDVCIGNKCCFKFAKNTFRSLQMPLHLCFAFQIEYTLFFFFLVQKGTHQSQDGSLYYWSQALQWVLALLVTYSTNTDFEYVSLVHEIIFCLHFLINQYILSTSSLNPKYDFFSTPCAVLHGLRDYGHYVSVHATR